MPIILADRVLDFGLGVLVNESKQFSVCTTQPTTYAQAITAPAGGGYSLGIYNYAGPAFTGPVANASPTGRKVSLTPISSATISVAGTAAFWAVVDSVNSRLLASGPFTAPIAVSPALGFKVGTFDIVIANANVLALLTAPSITVGSPVITAPNFASPAGSATASWQTLKIGGGGWITSIENSTTPDNTMVCRGDSFGAYLWDFTNLQWNCITTRNTLPAIDCDGAAFGSGLQDFGVFEIAVAKSNSSILYMLFNGRFYYSANKGSSWTRSTTFAQNANLDPSFNPQRMSGQKIGVDPGNPNAVAFGVPNVGLYYSIDGGVTVSKNATVPADNGNEIAGICCDPTSAVVSGYHQIWYCAVPGNGIWRTTTGLGGTWARIATTPNSAMGAAVINGQYWVCDQAGNLYVWNGSTFALKLTSRYGGLTFQRIIQDPNDSNHLVVISMEGSFNQSADNGATWSGIYGLTAGGQVFGAGGDTPWLETTNAGFMSGGGALFHPTIARRIIFSTGVGVVYTDSVTSNSLPTSTQIIWKYMTKGIENMVVPHVFSKPSGGALCSFVDRQFIVRQPGELETIPTHYGIGHVAEGNLWECMEMDYAKNLTTFLVAGVDNQDGPGVPQFQFCYSTDDGANFTPMANQPIGSTNGGMIVASTDQNFVRISGGASGAESIQYTLNRATSAWLAASGAPTSGWGGITRYYWPAKLIAADYVTPNKFYAIHPTGLYTSTNGGATWTGPLSIPFGVGNLPRLVAVPGNAGHLFFCSGYDGMPQPNTTFWKTLNGGTSWTQIANFLDVCGVGFGAVKPGSTYPTCYLAGFLSGAWGIYRSFNADQVSPTWTFLIDYPAGRIDGTRTVSGDHSDYQKCYIGYKGSSIVYGKNL
jgi:hypothetical protein